MKNISKYKYVKRRLILDLWKMHYFSQLLVKDKWWHRWKIYRSSCWEDDIDEIWNKQLDHDAIIL